jgi:hypothetical protein
MIIICIISTCIILITDGIMGIYITFFFYVSNAKGVNLVATVSNDKAVKILNMNNGVMSAPMKGHIGIYIWIYLYTYIYIYI